MVVGPFKARFLETWTGKFKVFVGEIYLGKVNTLEEGFKLAETFVGRKLNRSTTKPIGG